MIDRKQNPSAQGDNLSDNHSYILKIYQLTKVANTIYS